MEIRGRRDMSRPCRKTTVRRASLPARPRTSVRGSAARSCRPRYRRPFLSSPYFEPTLPPAPLAGRRPSALDRLRPRTSPRRSQPDAKDRNPQKTAADLAGARCAERKRRPAWRPPRFALRASCCRADRVCCCRRARARSGRAASSAAVPASHTAAARENPVAHKTAWIRKGAPGRKPRL